MIPLWEFLENEDIAKIVAPFFEVKNAEKAAEADEKWEQAKRWAASHEIQVE